MGLPGWLSGKAATCYAEEAGDPTGSISWRRAWQPTLVFVPWRIPWTRNLAGCSPQGRTGSHRVAHGRSN